MSKNKPILHVIVNKQIDIDMDRVVHQFITVLKYKFRNHYDCIISVSDTVNIIPDNTTIVNLHVNIDNDREIKKVISTLNDIAGIGDMKDRNQNHDVINYVTNEIVEEGNVQS